MSPSKKQLPESKPLVFVIDDDEGIRQALKSLLQSVGLKVETFASGADFLECNSPNVPSCLVLMSACGASAVWISRQSSPRPGIQVPIVFITGHGDIPMTVKAMKPGAVEFLPKPFRDQDLLDAVRVGLDRNRARRANEDVRHDSCGKA